MGSVKRDVCITGIGLVSSLGEGVDAHLARLTGAGACVVVDEATFAPYPVHPMVDLDFSGQIPRRGDQRQMEPWQRIGVYAAGLALDDAGIKGDMGLLGRAGMIVAAGNGERDTTADAAILEAITRPGEGSGDGPASLNDMLARQLRPTLYLAQQSQLLAGNISIVHKLTGSSRTFKGEEIAGVSAVETAWRRIASGESDIVLVGGAYNAERADMLLILELAHKLWRGSYRPLWERREAGGGMVTGSVGAFLVLEAADHATARGATVHAKLRGITTGRSARRPGEAAANGERLFAAIAADDFPPGPLAVLSGASGLEPATGEELAFIRALGAKGFEPAVRALASLLGAALEAQFPAGLALAAAALSRSEFFAPFDDSGVEAPYPGPPRRILVTGWGHWRGEGLALVEAVT